MSEVKQWDLPAAVSLVLKCGAAGRTARGPRMTIETNCSPLLRAIRYAMTLWVEQSEYLPATKLADRFGCDPAALELAMAQARFNWTDLKPKFPDPLLNLRLETGLQEAIRLEGTVDVSTLYGETVRMIGWCVGETGWERWARTVGMGLLATRCFGVPKAEIVLVDVKSGARQTRTFTTADLFDFEEKLLDLVANEHYRTGRHCEQCPQVGYCIAHGEMVTSCLQSIINTQRKDGHLAPRNNREELKTVVEQVEATAVELRRRMATHQQGSSCP